MKYAFIGAHESVFSVKAMCHVLGVQRSGYYAWKQRPPSRRELANQDLLEKIKEVFELSRHTYGSLRIQHYLLHKGYTYSRHRIGRLMKKAQLVPLKVVRWHPQTTKQKLGAKTAPNLLNQNFRATQSNQKWVSDITYIETAEGWLYLAAILDLYSRRVVGWAMRDSLDTQLVESAWRMAVINRRPPEMLLHHSDRGSQYTSTAYWNLLLASRCQVSMSRTGNCYDNATMESFFATLKGECATQTFKTKSNARTTIFEYIEGWYNQQRLHSSLGYLSPVAFEQLSGH